MPSSMLNGSVNEIFDQLNRKADLLYRFVMMYSSYIAEKNDYGFGEPLTMSEAHTLASIVTNPGITVTELAEYWNYTKGAISQTTKKLNQKAFIERRQMNGNMKKVYLFPTEKGLAFNRQHMIYDSIEVSDTIERLLKGCTLEEIDTFFKVIEQYIIILKEEQ